MPVAFVKVRQGEPGVLDREAGAIGLMWRSQPESFSAPEPLGRERTADLEWFATAALPAGLHRPASDPPLAEITREIGRAFADWPRPDGMPPHWEPMHGDLAPWNLRDVASGRPVLLDWEDVGWGPPRADWLFFRVVEQALRGRTTPPHDVPASAETARFLRHRAGQKVSEGGRFWDRFDQILDELSGLEA